MNTLVVDLRHESPQACLLMELANRFRSGLWLIKHESEEESGVNPSYSSFNSIVRGQALFTPDARTARREA